MKLRNLLVDELEKWFCFLVNDVFIGASIEVFRNQWYCDPVKDINGIFVAVDNDDNILSSVRVFLREIYLEGHKIKTGGIGFVGTKEDYRGKGLSTSLFQMSIDYMNKENINVSYLLCGSQNEMYYNRYDYQKCKLLKKISAVESNISYTFDYSIRNVDFSKDIEALSYMYHNFSSQFNGSAVRSSDYWKQWVVAFPYKQYLIAVDSNEKPIAYLNVDLDENRLFVFDFGYVPDYFDIFDSFISKVRSHIVNEKIDVQYQAVIHSNMQVDEYVENCLVMYSLINPIELDDMQIHNANELIQALAGSNSTSKLLLWEVDDI